MIKSAMELAAFTLFFFFTDQATTEIYTLSLHDAIPICYVAARPAAEQDELRGELADILRRHLGEDRKSTRMNSSHMSISYAVFCLKKKKKTHVYHVHPHAATSG